MFPRMSNPPNLTERVAGALLEKIDQGAFAPGARLPSESVLAAEFGVSRTVLREAISRLKHEGVVEGRQGSGLFVTEHAKVRPLRIEMASVESLESTLQIIELRRAIETQLQWADVARSTWIAIPTPNRKEKIVNALNSRAPAAIRSTR